MIGKYILEGKTPVRCDDVREWAKRFENSERQVAQKTVGEVTISTVFLGVDYGYGEPKPVLFETLVIGGPLDQVQVRYCTWDEAKAGHREMVKRVKTPPWGPKLKEFLGCGGKTAIKPEKELKACPFCRGPACLHSRRSAKNAVGSAKTEVYYVHCIDCGVHFHEDGNEGSATSQWNLREAHD